MSTVINYYIPENASSAVIRINDMNGKFLESYSITSKGAGQLVIKGNELSSGVYQYSLVLNGSIVDNKKMSIQ